MKINKEYFYPLWLRIWHWANAVLFMSLIITGLNLQYSTRENPLIRFDHAIQLHNISGIILTINYLFFFIMNIISGNIRQYIPVFKGIVSKLKLQAEFYIKGIFKNSDHPFETEKGNKFNPLQQITYAKIMYVLLPMVILSGWAMLFPEIIIEQFFNIPGFLFTSILHTAAGFILSIFMIGHIYLATTGTTLISNFKAMITGWHESHPKINLEPGANDEEIIS
ncbi:MAG TPA: cytochrome b/b6 domain-containing protein [Ignavibacteriaceae bacterium]|nr:cytochrome b/b6 domain-containing protein [Ignavibacteriaceae bacterium]